MISCWLYIYSVNYKASVHRYFTEHSLWNDFMKTFHNVWNTYFFVTPLDGQLPKLWLAHAEQLSRTHTSYISLMNSKICRVSENKVQKKCPLEYYISICLGWIEFLQILNMQLFYRILTCCLTIQNFLAASSQVNDWHYWPKQIFPLKESNNTLYSERNWFILLFKKFSTRHVLFSCFR